MTTLEWIFASILFVLYVTRLFTVCFLTFQKGYVALGIIGIFCPILWLIGAVLPAQQGSPYRLQQAARTRQLAQQTGQPGEFGQPGPGSPAAA